MMSVFDDDGDYSSDMNESVVQKLKIFDEFFIAHPRLCKIHACLDRSRSLAMAAPNAPQKGFRVLGPSGSGKTTAIRSYIAAVVKTEEDRRPVLYVPLTPNSTPRRLYASILKAAGDDYADSGTEDRLRRRAYEAKLRCETELIIFDEFQHLARLAGKGAYNWNVAECIKALLDDGWAAAFCGTFEAQRLFSANKQLANRMFPPMDLHPLRLDVEADLRIFQGFLGYLDKFLTENDLLSESANLMSQRILVPIHQVADGVLGVAANLIRAALEIALRAGDTVLRTPHISLAVDRWAIPYGGCDRNPFA